MSALLISLADGHIFPAMALGTALARTRSGRQQRGDAP